MMCFRLYPPIVLPLLLKLFKCPIKDKAITIMKRKLAFGPEHGVFVLN